jgi:acyl-CoA thioester hydrolase
MTAHPKPVWTERIKVRWGDMDALGHVNNAEYFRYMEQARVAWFEASNIPMMENGQGPVIVKATCEFLKPIVYPATVAISMHVKKVGRSSITVAHDFCLEDNPGVRFAHGEAVIVWVDHARGKSAPLPERVLRRFR